MSATLLTLGLLLAAPPRQLVLSIGNDVGLPGEESLAFAEADAQRFAQTFAEVGLGGEAPRVLAGQSRAAVLRALDEVRAWAVANPSRELSLILYFAGHGDAQGLHLNGERLAVAELVAAAERVPAVLKVLILDACRTSVRARGVAVGAPFELRARPGTVAGTVVISAAGEGEPAYESSALQGAVFTHFLLGGLRGLADLNGDGRVNVEEAFEHAWARTLERTAASRGAVQRPELALETRGAGSPTLTNPARSDAQLLLERAEGTQYLVFKAPSGVPMGEVSASPERELSLALPRGRYAVLRRREGSAPALLNVDLGWGGAASLAAGDWRAVEEKWLTARGPQEVQERWLLAAAAVLHTSFDGSGPGVGFEARGGLRVGLLRLGLGVGLTRASLERPGLTGQELRLTARPTVGVGVRTEWFEVEAYAGLNLVPTWQTLQRLDAARAAQAGFQTTSAFFGVTLGPLVGARGIWRARRQLGVTADVSGALEWFRDPSAQMKVGPRLAVGLGLEAVF